ncbi:hypothetical protein GCM10011344_12690 [Dokdonia pacifica]|uniref:Uncharacterized protein n=1 Tax=Dokdonia pacifica TaxID=1627892 RepID=A0A238WAY5_9FLAO|nr:hypothetical protein [Dokdonia pacifica]GGG13481.1 hypothetical protein GCM10011344_12690 [Dokdonia pacifica]SNR43658.1 hypothetical protein SAMN06265376_101883 [Dokdonia pacifica]
MSKKKKKNKGKKKNKARKYKYYTFQESNNPAADLRKLLLQITIGIGIIIPFFNTTSIFRFVALAGFLIAVHGIISLVRRSDSILFHYFPTKYEHESNPTFGDKIFEHIGGGLFGIGLFSLIFRIIPLDNTIGGLELFFISSGLGFVLGLLIAFVIRIIRPSVFDSNRRRMGVIGTYSLGLALLFASLASFINEKKASDTITKKDVEIVSKSSNTRKKDSYYIFILIEGEEERLELKKSAWDALNEGDMLTLELKNGYFNYPFITNFEKIKSGQW